MDSGKLRQLDRSVGDLHPTSHLDLIFIRRRAFLPLAEGIEIQDSIPTESACAPPAHMRSQRWKDDESFEMRRISNLSNSSGALIGYRSMIQQGHRSVGPRLNATFRATDFAGSLIEALRQAKLWRDAQETKLGIKPGRLRSKAVDRPWSGVSLIVATAENGRSYWGGHKVAGKKALRAYIGKRSYTDAYHDLIRRIAERDDIPLPEELPCPPPPRFDQHRRMTKAGLTGIPEPKRRRPPKIKNS